jgi:hypothetical protein
MQGIFFKSIITKEMIGKTCILPSSEETEKDIKKIIPGELIAREFFHKYGQEILRLFGTYWACCQLVSDNYSGDHQEEWDTKEKVSENIKIRCRYIKSWTHYHNEKTGESSLNLQTDSISFDEPQEKIKEYLLRALPKLAEVIGKTEDELVRESKERMDMR